MRSRRGLIIAGRRCGGGRLGLDDGGHPRGVRLPSHVLCVRQLVVFLVFHSAVLKPDLDLPLRQCKSVCNLNSTPACQVTVEVELLQREKSVRILFDFESFYFFQLEHLVPGVGRPLPLWLHPVGVVAIS